MPGETDIVVATLEVLGILFPTFWFSRNNTGAFRSHGHVRKFGLGKGSADIIGCARGRLIALEAKIPGEGQRPEQKTWQATIEAAGGFYAVFTSPREAIDAVRRAIESTAAA